MQHALLALVAAVPIVVGGLVLHRHPRGPIGWLLVAHGVSIFLLLAGGSPRHGFRLGVVAVGGRRRRPRRVASAQDWSSFAAQGRAGLRRWVRVVIRSIGARWRRPDGAAVSYLAMVFGADAIALATMWFVPTILDNGGKNSRYVLAMIVFFLAGLYVSVAGRISTRAVHLLSLVTIIAGNALVSCFDDPVARALAAGWNLLIVMYLSTSMSRRWVIVYGILCTVAANLMLVSMSAPTVVIFVRMIIITGLVFLPVAFFLLLRGELDGALAVARELATKDTLTGLLNRRGMQDAFPVLASATLKETQLVAVLICDIDHFKKINDTYGHSVGDEVIKQVSATLARNVCTGDVIVRLGGEEIAVFASVLDENDACLRAERLRQRVQNECQAWKVTVSIGVALAAFIPREQYTDTLDLLLNEADGRLYEAKRAGRNQVVGPPRAPAKSRFMRPGPNALPQKLGRSGRSG